MTDPETVTKALIDDLFVAGDGTRAQRLVLVIDVPQRRDLGGWSQEAATHRVHHHLQAAESTTRHLTDGAAERDAITGLLADRDEPTAYLKVEGLQQELTSTIRRLTAEKDELREVLNMRCSLHPQEACVYVCPECFESDRVADAKADAAAAERRCAALQQHLDAVVSGQKLVEIARLVEVNTDIQQRLKIAETAIQARLLPAEASLATLQAGIREKVELMRAAQTFGDAGSERWWRQCRVCSHYTEGQRGAEAHAEHQQDCPVGVLEALLGDPPASPTGEK